ncbi:sugar phosphate isomerase/epimerase [Microbispora sp. H11081]|uniref:sugar phosphate isomerase/epimerase family protein n=1 Tax=Microbispora sp. H11081 TaxID=2729107 RepID=UPI0014743E09|nr:sugar phosphate isomerase/epimerase family protein [Microbispora sp. H11081]
MSVYEEEMESAGKLGRRLGLSRRQLLAATTGMAAAAAITAAGPMKSAAQAAPSGPGPNGLLIPPPRRGIILYTVRDAISRDPLSSNLPSGFRAVFEELARIGYAQIEFAGYSQHPNAEGGASLENVEGARLLRSWLDDNGLVAQGNHGFIPSSWPLTQADLDRFKLHLEIANILGMGHVGTGSDPTGTAYKADWDRAAEKWNALGELATAAGLKLYTHNHDVAYSFLLDSGPLDAQGRPTRSSGIRRLEYFLQITDPKHVWLEMDIYWAHVAQYKHKTFTAPDGSTQTQIFDPLAVVRAQTKRFPLFHAKDGKINTGTANGYDMVPFGTGDIDYAKFFRGMGAKGYHHPMYEQDTAPGGNANPAQSLQYAALSYDNMSALRG